MSRTHTRAEPSSGWTGKWKTSDCVPSKETLMTCFLIYNNIMNVQRLNCDQQSYIDIALQILYTFIIALECMQ